MKSGATESSFHYLSQFYTFPEEVEVSHLPEVLEKSNKKYKVLWAHHSYDQPVFINFKHETVNHIVTPSHWAKEQLIRFHHIPKNKITVIANGVSDIFQYSQEKSKTFIHTSIPYKGLELLPAIIRRIHTIHPDAKFKIFSSMSLYGPSNDPYIELYEELKTLPNVEYSQAVDQEELVSHYQDAAFFIHPNIWEETFCVSMAEAMKCGCYPIITNIGALTEVTTDQFASVVPIEGDRTPQGYKVTENFINTFAEVCCTALDYFERDRSYYNQISKSASNHISQKCDWSKIAKQWQKLITQIISGEPMTEPNTSALSYQPVNAEQAVTDDTYLRQAFENVLKWEESDKELAQGRTNFQLEKFALLESHTLPAAFESTLKARRQMAEGYMFKLIEMKEKVREFEYKWGDKDHTKPIEWECTGGGPGGGGKKLCWFDLDELQLTHYLKSCELEIRDRLHQMEHLDKILEKLVEQNGGKPVTRQQYLDNDGQYWERRFAEQAMDEMISAQTGISIGNIHSMRRASSPAIVDERNTLPEGYLAMNKLLESPQGKMEFLNDLQKKVLQGIQEVTGENLGLISGTPEEQKKLEGN
jgi:glycosyltransferase involved in cell wall biosynthesis